MDFLTNNWPIIATAVGAAYPVAWAIAKATKTKKDDEIVGKIGRFLDIIFPKTRPK